MAYAEGRRTTGVSEKVGHILSAWLFGLNNRNNVCDTIEWSSRHQVRLLEAEGESLKTGLVESYMNPRIK